MAFDNAVPYPVCIIYSWPMEWFYIAGLLHRCSYTFPICYLVLLSMPIQQLSSYRVWLWETSCFTGWTPAVKVANHYDPWRRSGLTYPRFNSKVGANWNGVAFARVTGENNMFNSLLHLTKPTHQPTSV